MLWSHGAGCRLGGGGTPGTTCLGVSRILCVVVTRRWMSTGGGGDVFRCEQNTLCCGHTALDVDWGGATCLGVSRILCVVVTRRWMSTGGGGGTPGTTCLGVSRILCVVVTRRWMSGGGGVGDPVDDVFRCEQNTLCCGHTALDVDWGGGATCLGVSRILCVVVTRRWMSTGGGGGGGPRGRRV